MVEISNKQLIAGIFILISLVGTTYYIAEQDNAYYCQDENSVGLCEKLSSSNSEGLQTRCYYNNSDLTKYNYCKSGWIKYEKPEVTGTIIDNEKIEIIEGTYYVYKLSEKYTLDEIIEEKKELNKSLIYNKNEYAIFNKTKNTDLAGCLNYVLKEKNYSEQLIADCYFDYYSLENYYIFKIEEINYKLNKLEKLEIQ